LHAGGGTCPVIRRTCSGKLDCDSFYKAGLVSEVKGLAAMRRRGRLRGELIEDVRVQCCWRPFPDVSNRFAFIANRRGEVARLGGFLVLYVVF
jgi:hypothetical protein